MKEIDAELDIYLDMRVFAQNKITEYCLHWHISALKDDISNHRLAFERNAILPTDLASSLNSERLLEKLICRNNFKRVSLATKSYNMDILRQTTCMAINQIMKNNFASLFNCTTAALSSICFRWLTINVGLIVFLFVVIKCSSFRSPLSPLLCFITLVFIICVHCDVSQMI